MLANVSVKKYLYHIFMDEEQEEKKKELLEECKNSKIILLWKIMHETEIDDTDLLKERIYEFGSKVKEDDYLGREIFLCLVACLNLVIKEKT